MSFNPDSYDDGFDDGVRYVLNKARSTAVRDDEDAMYGLYAEAYSVFVDLLIEAWAATMAAPSPTPRPDRAARGSRRAQVK